MNGKKHWTTFKCGHCNHEMKADSERSGLTCMYCGKPVWKVNIVEKTFGHLQDLVANFTNTMRKPIVSTEPPAEPEVRAKPKKHMRKERAERLAMNIPIIMRLKSRGVSAKQLADQYDVSYSTMIRILSGNWRPKNKKLASSIKRLASAEGQ